MIECRQLNLLEAFSNEPKPLDFILPGMLSQSVGSIVSPGGLGKSYFALELAIQIAGGPDLLGLGELKNGHVLYLPAEDPLEAVSHRVHALAPLISVEQRKILLSSLRIESFFGWSPDLLEKVTFDKIKKMAEGKRLVIIDTLRRFHREDENSSGAMAAVISQMEAICFDTGCSFLFLHHATKSSTTYGDKPQASRGSGVLVDNIRWQSQLISLTKNEGKDIGIDEWYLDNFVKFKITKQNYGPPIKDKLLQRGKGGVLLPLETTARKNKYDSLRMFAK